MVFDGLSARGAAPLKKISAASEATAAAGVRRG
jgi:hypothetical protein